MGRPRSSTPTHTRACLCAIGDELTLGQNIDTNSAWIADRLASIGVPTIEHATVADDEDAIAATIRRLSQLAPLVICTGGLGPTPDDCTRAALALAMGEELVEDRRAIEWLDEYSALLSKPLPKTNRVQALRPVTATLIHNPNGTAPGIHARLSAGGRPSDVYCLPGPPREMQPMFEAAVAPAIDGPVARTRTKFINTFGLGESAIARRLPDLLARDATPMVGLTTDGVDVRFRIRAEGDDDEVARQFDRATETVHKAVGSYVFSEGETPLCEVVIGLLRERREWLASVESCTGGLLGSMLTSVPGSSEVYSGGWVTYSNAMKEAVVRVPQVTLDKFGAVSEPVARAMAEGALLAAPEGGADHALAITGIAGPGGGTDDKPVGTVYIACASRATDDLVRTQVRRFRFTGDRDLVRRRSAQAALAMLRWRLLGADEDGGKAIAWQVSEDTAACHYNPAAGL
ncbi:MAG: CinA family nicotinamide mononucleotide deamidase-related protein [Phycisphaeraceae bacterium]|nr:CinA family nicotinamide mononucleotide deamidase-related protein [Phycisphaeraceae bacterium]